MNTTVKQVDNHTDNKNCVLYYRVSRRKQNDLRQERDCLIHCENNGFTVVTEPFREKKSGMLRNRPEMTKCLEYIKANNIKYLICSELSRLGRTLEASTLIDTLTLQKVCIISLREKIKTLNDDFTENKEMTSNALFAIRNAINENLDKSYRIISARNERIINNGSWSGGKYLPYGYQSIDKKLVIEPTEAEWVKQIFEKYLNSWGAVKIANWLNMQGIPTKLGLKWDRATINQMLGHLIYIGQRQWKGTSLDTPYLRIISDEAFFAVQKRRKERKNPDATFNKLKKYTYLFDCGIMVCGVCGKKFSGLGGLNKYSCVSGSYTKCCGCESVSLDWLEEAVQVHLLENWYKLIKDNTIINQQNEKLEIDLKLLRAELQNKQEQLDRTNEMYGLNRMNRPAYDLKYNEVSNQIAKVMESIEQIQEKLINSKRAMEVNNSWVVNPDYTNIDGKRVWKYENIDKDSLHKVIKQIIVNKRTKTGQLIDVLLVNGKQFQLNFIPKRMTILKAGIN
jgi:site-specific DNA recombinase